MSRRILLLLLYRLDRSPLPMLDPVRLELEAELLVMLSSRRNVAAELRAGWALGVVVVGEA